MKIRKKIISFICTISVIILINNYTFAENIIENKSDIQNEVIEENILEETNSTETERVNSKEENNNEIIFDENNTVYIEDVINTGKDNGYSKNKKIENGDVHYGWKLGKFIITDFSSKRTDANGNYVLLKNAGDKVSLYFNLLQDIDKLDNNENLRICEDENGYDNEFNIKKSNFGKGMLIVRKIDSNGNKNDPILYKDYLKGIQVGANTRIDVFEEGDYEVALDYEVRNNGVLFFDSYNNYRIRFNFSVRNGNCMIFPFDVSNKSELNNTSITENGFYLDLANSKYLNVNIKKEMLKEGADGLVEDTRFNRPAKSGEEYIEEGIYTITAENVYTGEKTIKKIYVGQNKLLKAHVQNSEYSIAQIKNMVSQGAIIDENGNISNVPAEYKQQVNNKFSENSSLNINEKSFNYLVVIVPLLLLILFIMYKVINKKKIERLTKVKVVQKEQENAKNNNSNINIEESNDIDQINIDIQSDSADTSANLSNKENESINEEDND